MEASSQRPGPGGGTAAPERDLAIDLARFICLALVVVGHCMMASPVLHPDGTVTTENTLAEQDWFELIIWIFMVMPLFFVTGGITGLQSWRRMQARGRSGEWTVQRMVGDEVAPPVPGLFIPLLTNADLKAYYATNAAMKADNATNAALARRYDLSGLAGP